MSNNNWHPKKELCGYISEDGSLVSLENLATKADREIWLIWRKYLKQQSVYGIVTRTTM